MSDIQFNNKNNQTISQARPVQTPCVSYPYAYNQTVPGINNTNNTYYVPTYQQPYYTSNYGYQVPCVHSQYPSVQTVQQYPPTTGTVAPVQQQQITPGATIQTGGAKCEIPPGTNGLNIIINSPTVAAPGSQPMINTNSNYMGSGGTNGSGNGNASAAAASASTNNDKKNQKTKNIVALTDDYIKNLENYLRSPNKDLKVYAIKEVANRFAEDEKRRTNPSLNALLNLALQAKEPQVRFLALALLTSGAAGGNDITVQILNNMQQSSAYQGAEANDAKKALLKMSETVVRVPDNSPSKPKSDKENNLWE